MATHFVIKQNISIRMNKKNLEKSCMHGNHFCLVLRSSLNCTRSQVPRFSSNEPPFLCLLVSHTIKCIYKMLKKCILHIHGVSYARPDCSFKRMPDFYIICHILITYKIGTNSLVHLALMVNAS